MVWWFYVWSLPVSPPYLMKYGFSLSLELISPAVGSGDQPCGTRFTESCYHIWIFFLMWMLMFQTQPLILAKQEWYQLSQVPSPNTTQNSSFVQNKLKVLRLSSFCVVLFILPNKFLSHFCLQRIILWQNLMDSRTWME